MNLIDHRLNRLLEAAQRACPPIPEPSPWFEQRMIQLLRAEKNPFCGYFEGVLIFRVLMVAVVIMAVSVTLPLAQTKNPYVETLDLANSTVQMVQMR
jgi:hypothetical protein